MPTSVPKYGELSLCLSDADGNSIPLKLDSSDKLTTENAFKKNKNRLDFFIKIDTPIYEKSPSSFYLYLGGSPLRKWDDDYSIRLVPKAGYWFADDDDIKRIKKQFWCASTARITLCDASKKPILTETGSLIETTIGLSYDDWYFDLYENVKAGLQSLNQQADITTPFEQLVNISKAAREEAEDSEILALYLRIRNFLPSFIYCVEAIVKNPAQRIKSNIKTYAFQDFGDPEYEQQLEGRGNLLLAAQNFAQADERYYPCSFTTVETEISYEIEENLLVLQCLIRTKSYLETIILELEKYINDITALAKSLRQGIHRNQLLQGIDKHKIKHTEIQEYIHHCNYCISRFPIAKSHKIFQPFNLSSELLYYDQRYSTIWKLAAKIDNFIKYIDTSDEAIPFQVAPFQEVYQKWCLLRVVASLELLDFVKVAEGKTTPLYGNPRFNTLFCEMRHTKNPDLRLEIYFERKYEFIDQSNSVGVYGFWKPLCRSLPPEEWKHTPDIALEFHNSKQKYPYIITLDPTLGGYGAWQKKYKYRDTLQANDAHEEVNIVKAAWAIAPGQRHENSEPFYTDARRPSFSKGTIILSHTPKSQERLKDTLYKIISANKLAILD